MADLSEARECADWCSDNWLHRPADTIRSLLAEVEQLRQAREHVDPQFVRCRYHDPPQPQNCSICERAVEANFVHMVDRVRDICALDTDNAIAFIRATGEQSFALKHWQQRAEAAEAALTQLRADHAWTDDAIIDLGVRYGAGELSDAQFIAAIRSGPELPHAWQDIATAPKDEEWVILAEHENGRLETVRGGYRTANEAGHVRSEMEGGRTRYRDTTNLIVTTRANATARIEASRVLPSETTERS